MIAQEELRQIVREEIERGLIMLLEAKTTATAIKKGLFYSDAPLHRFTKKGQGKLYSPAKASPGGRGNR